MTNATKHDIIKTLKKREYEEKAMIKKEINKEQLEEIKTARKENKNKRAEKRLELLEMRAKGFKDIEIAEKTGFHQKYVGILVAKYHKEGLERIIGKKREANRRNMSYAEENAFLEQFREKAANGQIVAANEIKAEYEKIIGHKCGNGQIYRLLKRHDYRKVKPRGKHPKSATPEAIEASKKLTTVWNT